MTQIFETELEAVRENARMGEHWLCSTGRAQYIAIRLDGILKEVLTELFGVKPKGTTVRQWRIELYRYLFANENKRPENGLTIKSGKDLTVGEVWALDMLAGQANIEQTLGEWIMSAGNDERQKGV